MKYTWHLTEIKTKEDAYAMVARFRENPPKYSALDTEADGLHIIYATPFIVQFGWTTEDMQGYAYGIDLEAHPIFGHEVVKSFLWMAQRCELFMGHNLKFDLHMLKNLGFDYRRENMTDTMFYIRYGTDAVQEDKGGAPLKLKRFAARYIDPSAKEHEHLLNLEKTAIAARYNKELRTTIGMRQSDIDKFFKDQTNDIEDLPAAKQKAYREWRAGLPSWLQNRFEIQLNSDHIPYNKLNRANVMRYALYDIVWTLETFHCLREIVDVRQNNYAVQLENSLILPFLDMERVGFEIDKTYLEQSRLRMKHYIRKCRASMHALAGQQFTTGQHAVIKSILTNRFGLHVITSDDEGLSRLEADALHPGETYNPDAAEFIGLLRELRTLEKWYGTYILRFRHDLRTSDRLYTTINQVGTISGRVTSDFQQFPKDAIKTKDGEEIFSPRRMIIKNKEEEYDGLVYIDYSQIELRLQAMYTILVGHPEPNLCRAYMPYNCHDANGVPFSPQNPAHIAAWQQDWFLDESPTVLWQPLDVHAATTRHAFGITDDDPTFKRLRYEGKRVNFAKNYGASYKRIRQMFPQYTDEQIHQIDDAYYIAFPGVKAYHDYCYRLALSQAYGMNLFGGKYYNMSGHNLINTLIQGTGAFFLKIKIRALWEYSKEHHIKSRMQMNIHDEISWEKHRDESAVFFTLKAIMESWGDTLVPIVAEMEVSHDAWADKKPVKSLEDLR